MRQFLRLERRTIRDGTETATYAITSVPPGVLAPVQRLTALRGRRDIEHRTFRVFGMVFGEDAGRIRTGTAPHLPSVVRAAAVNFLQGHGLPRAATLREHAFKVERLFTRLGLMK